MPDLSIEIMGTCKTNIAWERDVEGSQGTYTVRFERVNPEVRQVQYDYTCTCGDYKYRRAVLPGQYCKHVLKVRSERCGWHELIHGGKAEIHDDGEVTCPMCGGPAEFYREAV